MSQNGYKVETTTLRDLKQLINSDDENRLALLAKPVKNQHAAYGESLRREGGAIRRRLEELSAELGLTEEEREAIDQSVSQEE